MLVDGDDVCCCRSRRATSRRAAARRPPPSGASRFSPEIPPPSGEARSEWRLYGDLVRGDPARARSVLRLVRQPRAAGRDRPGRARLRRHRAPQRRPATRSSGADGTCARAVRSRRRSGRGRFTPCRPRGAGPAAVARSRCRLGAASSSTRSCGVRPTRSPARARDAIYIDGGRRGRARASRTAPRCGSRATSGEWTATCRCVRPAPPAASRCTGPRATC